MPIELLHIKKISLKKGRKTKCFFGTFSGNLSTKVGYEHLDII